MNAIKGFVVALLLLAATTSNAQWTNDPAVNTPVSNQVGTNQFKPQIIADGFGGAIITWLEASLDFSTGSVYAQHLSPAGTKLWAANGVNISGDTALPNDPLITTDGNGGAIISWASTKGGAVKHYVQKINAAGQLQWPAGGVLASNATVSPLTNHLLVGDEKGGAILLWDDTRAGNLQIYAQRFNNSGTLQWGAGGTPASPNFTNILSCDAVADTAGGVLLCYSMVTNLLYMNEVFFQHVKPDGSWMFGGLGKELAHAPSDQLYPKIAKDTDDNVIVVWQDFQLDPVWSRLYAQRIDSAGNERWPLGGILIVDSIVPTSTFARIVPDAKRGAVITWLDNFATGSTTAHLLGVRIDSAGNFVWNKKEIASWEGQVPYPYSLVPDYKGGAYIPFSKTINGTQDADMGAQHILPNGAIEYAITGMPVSTAPLPQILPQITSDTTGVAIVTWMDLRSNADYDVYAMRIAAPIGLPITGIRFTAKTVQQTAVLEWVTDSEFNNKGFVVQRWDGGMLYDSIGFVPASAVKKYSFTDNDPKRGYNYYRLKQVDLNGQFMHTHVVWAKIGGNAKLQLYPNPASRWVAVNGADGKSIISVYSTDGRKLIEQREPLIEISHLPRGVYYVRVGGTSLSFIKQSP